MDFEGINVKLEFGPSTLLDLAPEEDLDLDELSTAHRDEFGIAVAFSSLQLVLIQDEDTVFARASELQNLLGNETVGGGETPFEVCRLVDVIVQRAREDQVLCDEPFGRVSVLSEVRVEGRADYLRIGHGFSWSSIRRETRCGGSRDQSNQMVCAADRPSEMNVLPVVTMVPAGRSVTGHR